MSQIDPNIVDALTHSGQTVDQLKARLSELLTQLTSKPDAIVRVSTGGGASYEKRDVISLPDLIACYRAAIAEMEGESTQSNLAQFAYPVQMSFPR